ncbi:MAG: LamG domain-containing protein [Paludibacter sp.]|nr:LamG domain-containing protein [Paludibacter sp.]
MGITEVTVPKQYVLVQATEPIGAFEGQLWYNTTTDITYIYQDDDWQQVTLDVSSSVLELATENAQQQIDIIELQANASVTPFDHDTLLSDTFSDADGFKDSVNTTNTTAVFSINGYRRGSGAPDYITGIVSYYNFDETSGNLLDTVGSNDLTNTDVTQGETGINGNSYLYDGLTSMSRILTDIGLTYYPLTFAGWVKIAEQPSDSSQTILSYFYGPSGRNAYYMYYVDSGGTKTLNFQVYKMGVESIVASYETTLTTGQWYYVGATFDNTNVKLYLNGQLVATTAGSGTGSSSSSDRIFAFGGETDGTASFKGYLDEWAVFDAVLTQAQLEAIYDSQKPTTTAKIVEIDLPTITGTISHTELVVNGTTETGASITYKLNNGTTDDTEETINTQNTYNLTGVPTKLKIYLNPKSTNPTIGNPSVQTYCLKVWKVV